jgi:CsoR family transcriptional regulator, copper-sensing transcriptional repressor
MPGPRMHDPVAKQAMRARLARIEGQVRALQRMIERDEECEAIAQQLSAARKALDRAFYEMVACMIRHGAPPARGAGRAAGAGQVAELLARYG